jgi:hypothetical protein
MSKLLFIVFYYLFCQNKSAINNIRSFQRNRINDLPNEADECLKTVRLPFTRLSNQKNLLVKGFTLIVHIRD